MEPPTLAYLDDLAARHADDPDAHLGALRALIPTLEQALWAHGPDPALLPVYQTAHRHLEALLAGRGADRRHKFVVVIPVADRPRHLEACLDSLLRLCELYHYGGRVDGRYPKVAVVIADDSREAAAIERNRELARHYSDLGIATLHLDQAQQGALLDAAGPGLTRVLGDLPRHALYHKGPSLMRNIVYLKLRELAQQADEPLLFHFIDSDQEFQIKVATPAGDRDLYALSYFHQLDALFSRGDLLIATGKVVGDPPVSPAVMASNFLDDVAAFLARMVEADPQQPCGFHHGAPAERDAGAIYHDMADLFGFTRTRAAYDYACDLPGAHCNGACLHHFAGQLGRFFYGEHPTRKSRYDWDGPLHGADPARTIYTGNYIFRPAALRYFIPFATLRLRMAGPVLGRIIKAEVGARFVAANVPMLHQRTVRATGTAEFRPGVDDAATLVDLAGEFERQFFGDVMLFAIERLVALGYPQQRLAPAAIVEALEATHAGLLDTYNQRRQVIGEKLERLRAGLTTPRAWWSRAPEHATALRRFGTFAANIAHNFGADAAGYARINDPAHWAERRAAMAEAIVGYRDDRAAWEAALALP